MASSPDCTAPARAAPPFYNLAWRWHFYAGLFVIPFMILLSITGIIYLFTGGLFLLGVLYDFWTLNTQISIRNAERNSGR